MTSPTASEPETRTAAFVRFRFSFFEDANSARDGLDTRALAQLEGDERTRAEDMLLGYLPDVRGVIGLGVLRSQRAEPWLTTLFEAERSSAAWIDIAKALWQIRPDPRWLAAMIAVLASSDEWTQRMEAAIALRDVCDPAAVKPLIRALDDAEPLVRHHAAHALLAIHGAPADSRDPQHMIYRVMADDTARRESGKRDILAAISGRPMCVR